MRYFLSFMLVGLIVLLVVLPLYGHMTVVGAVVAVVCIFAGAWIGLQLLTLPSASGMVGSLIRDGLERAIGGKALNLLMDSNSEQELRRLNNRICRIAGPEFEKRGVKPALREIQRVMDDSKRKGQPAAKAKPAAPDGGAAAALPVLQAIAATVAKAENLGELAGKAANLQNSKDVVGLCSLARKYAGLLQKRLDAANLRLAEMEAAAEAVEQSAVVEQPAAEQLQQSEAPASEQDQLRKLVSLAVGRMMLPLRVLAKEYPELIPEGTSFGPAPLEEMLGNLPDVLQGVVERILAAAGTRREELKSLESNLQSLREKIESQRSAAVGKDQQIEQLGEVLASAERTSQQLEQLLREREESCALLKSKAEGLQHQLDLQQQAREEDRQRFIAQIGDVRTELLEARDALLANPDWVQQEVELRAACTNEQGYLLCWHLYPQDWQASRRVAALLRNRGRPPVTPEFLEELGEIWEIGSDDHG